MKTHLMLTDNEPDYKMIYTRKMYDKRKLHPFKFLKDWTVKSILYIKGDEYDTYNFNYDRLISLLKDNVIL